MRDPRGAGRTHLSREATAPTRSRPKANGASLAPTSRPFDRARSLVYLEDQYLWSIDGRARTRRRRFAVTRSCASSRSCPAIRTATAARRGAATASDANTSPTSFAKRAGDRVAIYDLENAEGTPIYVHAKVCVIDDVLLMVGSDNLNRRSWTHDSEDFVLSNRLRP